MEETGKNAFVTLITSDPYVAGALVLARSLQQTNTKARLIALVGPYVSSLLKRNLSHFFELIPVSQLHSLDHHKLDLIGRPELIYTLTKLHVWNLYQVGVDKAVFMDADMMVLKNVDDLFEREELSACADVGWPDCFNSGLFVCQPSKKTFDSLTEFAASNGSFDGGDQGLLNAYFSDWSTGPSNKRIPFTYNMTFNAAYTYVPAFQHYRSQLKVVHFFGAKKPWNLSRDSNGNVIPLFDLNSDQMSLYQQWWNTYDSVSSQLKNDQATQQILSHHFVSKITHLLQGNGCSISERNGHSSEPRCEKDLDFVNYRVEWNSQVETHFRKNSLKKRAQIRETFQMPDDEIALKLGKSKDFYKNEKSSGCDPLSKEKTDKNQFAQ